MTTKAANALSAQLPGFFGAYAKTRSASEKPTLSSWLAGFFDNFAAYSGNVQAPVRQSSAIDADALAVFLESLGKPLIASRHGAFQFDPWEVAGLAYDEVRNTGVLAWLLNPQGSHGLGFAAMNGLLTTVNHHFVSNFDGEFSAAPGRFCRVRTEINPNGEIADRVDIEIDAESFYLIIEVKIRAPEQPRQLERYCRQAKERSGGRPWAVIFLTPQGRMSDTAGEYADSGRVIKLSWKKLASTLERELSIRRSTSDQPLSLSRQIAKQAVRRFLKKIRLF